jgi:hypothetical protein
VADQNMKSIEIRASERPVSANSSA